MMSVVKIHGGAAAHVVSYIMGKNNDRPACSMTIGAVAPDRFVRTAIAATKNRRIQVQHMVISWSPQELDVNNPADHVRAMDAAVDLIHKAFGAAARAQLALHDDSKGQCLHIHAAIINAASDGFALSTYRDAADRPDAPCIRDDGKACYATKQPMLAPINDAVMKAHGMSVCIPSPHKETAISRHRPDEYSWMSDLQSRIDDAVDSVDSYDALVDTLTDRGVDVRIRKKDNAITSFGFTDADGKVRKARTIKLGTNYTDDALRRRIEQAQEQKGHILMAIDEKSLNAYVDAMLRSWKASHEKSPKQGMPSMPSGNDHAMPEKPLSRLEQAQRQHDTISRRWANTRVPRSAPASMTNRDAARVTAAAALTYADTARTFARRAALNGDDDRAMAWNKAAFVLNGIGIDAAAAMRTGNRPEIDPRDFDGVIGDGYVDRAGFGGDLLHMAMEQANSMDDSMFADACGCDPTYLATGEFVDWQIGELNTQLAAYDAQRTSSINLHMPDVDVTEQRPYDSPSLG